MRTHQKILLLTLATSTLVTFVPSAGAVGADVCPHLFGLEHSVWSTGCTGIVSAGPDVSGVGRQCAGVSGNPGGSFCIYPTSP